MEASIICHVQSNIFEIRPVNDLGKPFVLAFFVHEDEFLDYVREAAIVYVWLDENDNLVFQRLNPVVERIVRWDISHQYFVDVPTNRFLSGEKGRNGT